MFLLGGGRDVEMDPFTPVQQMARQIVLMQPLLHQDGPILALAFQAGWQGGCVPGIRRIPFSLGQGLLLLSASYANGAYCPYPNHPGRPRPPAN